MDDYIHIKQFRGFGLGQRIPWLDPVVAVEAAPLQSGPPAMVKFVNVERVPGGRDMAEALLGSVGILVRDFAGRSDIWPLRDAGLQGRWFYLIEDRTQMLSLREALDLHGPIDAASAVDRAGPLVSMAPCADLSIPTMCACTTTARSCLAISFPRRFRLCITARPGATYRSSTPWRRS